jgi:hypothetical protein
MADKPAETKKEWQQDGSMNEKAVLFNWFCLYLDPDSGAALAILRIQIRQTRLLCSFHLGYSGEPLST